MTIYIKFYMPFEVLTDDGALIRRLTDPRFEHSKAYFVQVEGAAGPETARRLTEEIVLPDLQTRLACSRNYRPTCRSGTCGPQLPPHNMDKNGALRGKKHQIRRMTAAVGFPTLRRVSVAIGAIGLENLQPGEWLDLTRSEINLLRTAK